MDLERKNLELLNLTPFYEKDTRSSCERAKAARRRTAPINEYIKVREKSLGITIYEALRVSGVPEKVSAQFVRQVLESHQEEWGRREAGSTKHALDNRRIPVTQTPELSDEIRTVLRNAVSWDILDRSIDGRLPRLRGLRVPKGQKIGHDT